MKFLATLDMGNNLLVYLDKDLFANNKFLETVILSNNRLRIIEVDFTIYPFLEKAYLIGNKCIDAMLEPYYRNFTIEKLQSLINHYCL